MKDYIEERVLEVAQYIIYSRATIRKTAKVFGVSKSTIHKDMTERLPKINPDIAEEAKNHHQFSKKYQEIYDMAIEKCPYFADAYQARSVAYLKSGDFLTWKKLIDKAL